MIRTQETNSRSTPTPAVNTSRCQEKCTVFKLNLQSPLSKNVTYLTDRKTWGGGNLMEISWSAHHGWKYTGNKPTCTSVALWFSVLLPHNLVCDISDLSHLKWEAFVFMCMRVYLCARFVLFCVSVGYEKIKLGEGQLASLQTLLDLSVSHNHAHMHTPAQGIRCKVPQFKVWHKHYQVLYLHLKWDENQKSCLLSLSVAVWGGSPHMFVVYWLVWWIILLGTAGNRWAAGPICQDTQQQVQKTIIFKSGFDTSRCIVR